MLLLSTGSIWLDEGEIVPMKCVHCGKVYTPPAGSQSSECPKCGVRNAHSDGGFVLTEMKAND